MVVTIKYEDLCSNTTDLSRQIAEGFGNSPECLGIVVITDLPGFVEKRERLLRLASVFAALPEEAKQRCVHEASIYCFGWSHGKERIEGSLDFAKGSYYNNPLHDTNPNHHDPDYKLNNPTYGYDNVWPAELPELKEAYMDLGGFIAQVGFKLARHCDKYIHARDPAVPEGFLQNALETSTTHKARLLHYFPVAEKAGEGKMGSWCGLHVDHAMLTGLTSAMYVRDSDPSYTEINVGDLPAEERGDLEQSGLYIQDRGGSYIKVNIPRASLAFQLGEASQLASGGLLVATPHLVKSGAAPGVSRNTFAVFLQPETEYVLRDGVTFRSFTEEVMKRHY
ncbi:hypothetical protein HDU96_001787 [Phlyctochytrium bullatum]|nr:hypothetical protein HDU96_001787 [Phlyctochytrium bullatum]